MDSWAGRLRNWPTFVREVLDIGRNPGTHMLNQSKQVVTVYGWIVETVLLAESMGVETAAAGRDYRT